jgi:DNA invertase Pin-like site-specific DNA recombinase
MSRVKAYGYIKSSGTEENSEEKQKDAIKRFADAWDIEIWELRSQGFEVISALEESVWIN